MTRSHRVRPRQFFTPVLAASLLVVLLPWTTTAAQSLPDDRSLPDLWTSNESPADLDWSDRVPAHVAAVDGDAWLERDGRTEPAEENVPLLAGDRLWTERGRLEVLFADGTSLALDEYTDLDLLSDHLARLESGRISLTVSRGASTTAYRVDSAGTTTWIRAAGEYAITTTVADGADGEVQVLVMRGLAEISSPFGRSLVRAGYEASASARTQPTLPYAVTVSSWDAFSRWTDAQQTYRSSLSSTSYLPDELRYYGGVLDRQGTWQYEPVVGYVWYPHVDTAWRPYSVGRWSVVGTFGWTWIGPDRWSWPTHHYGRWGLSGTRWYWIPGRRWAPAWVSWASTPSYVGWSPLGYNNRPLIDIDINIGRTWRAWSVAPARSFYSGVVVASRDVIRPVDVGRGFVLRSAPPRFVSAARGTAPATRGPVAVPRDRRVAVSPNNDRELAVRSSSPGSLRRRTNEPRPAAARSLPSTAERESPPITPRARIDRTPSRSVVTPAPVQRPSQRVYSSPSRENTPDAVVAPRPGPRPGAAPQATPDGPRNRQPRRAPGNAVGPDRERAPRAAPASPPRGQEPRQRENSEPGSSRPTASSARQAPAPPAAAGQGRAQPRRGR